MGSSVVEKQLYTVPEASSLLPICRDQIYTLIYEGQIPIIRIGAKIFIKKVDLDIILSLGTLPKPTAIRIGKEE